MSWAEGRHTLIGLSPILLLLSEVVFVKVVRRPLYTDRLNIIDWDKMVEKGKGVRKGWRGLVRR